MLAKKQTVAQIADRFNAALAAKEAKEAAMSLEAVEPKNQKKKKAKVFELKEKAEKQAVAKYATDLCCSPFFFPVAKHEMALDVEFSEKEGILLSEGPWGTLHYIGKRLTVYDEDFLLALMAVINEDEKKYTASIIDADGQLIRNTYVYKGCLRQILCAMGQTTPAAKHYDAAIKSISRLGTGVFRITKPGKKASVIEWHNILGDVKYIQKKNGRENTIRIEVGGFFYDAVYSGAYSKVNMSVRNQISSQTGKAIHRFASAHSGGITIGLEKLAHALNIKFDPTIGTLVSELRRQIKTNVQKLVECGVLEKGCGFVRDDIVFLKLK